MADFRLQVLELGDIRQRIISRIAKADLAAIFELDLVAAEHDFLAPGQRNEAAVCAGVDQKEAIAPSFNPCVLPRGLAVYHE